MNLVSVIIPTYGGGDGIKKVIDSVLCQTYKDIEIIVVDDNGRETENQLKTAEELKEYIEQKKIQYITPESNAGGSAARNTGAKASGGEYLMFLDDDDTVSPDKIEKQVEALKKAGKKCGLAYCSTKVFSNGELSNIIAAKKSGDILYRYMMGKIYIGTGTALILREAWESLGGYDESFKRHQDWEFFARVLNKYEAVAVPDAYFNRYITNRNLKKRADILETYCDHYIAFLKNYDFRISKNKLRNVINQNNSRIALQCLKEKNVKKCKQVLLKYDNAVRAYLSFALFCVSVCIDKFTGKKS